MVYNRGEERGGIKMGNDSKETQVTPSSKKTYIEMFNANYAGTSDEAKQLKTDMKTRDTGKKTVSYIPWAVMTRMATQQDPEMKLVKELAPDGTFVFYHGRKDKEGYPLDDSAYFVKATATWFGKTISEEYPIQDFDFEPVSFTGRKRILASGKTVEIKMYANIINKALQRATAKVLSILTGIGLSLYESGDLQFEDDTEQKGKDEAKKATDPKPVAKTEVKTETNSANTPQPSETKSKVVTTNADVVQKSELGVEMATQEQIDMINEFAKDEKKAVRIQKALTAYKATSIDKLTHTHAKVIIDALNK
jgi:hypothetical protein